MIKMNADFKFKGDRKYIHGPDIYNSIASAFKEKFSNANIEKMTLSVLKRSGQHQSIFFTNRKEDLAESDLNCRFQIDLKTGEIVFGGLSDRGEVVTESYAYDESHYVTKSFIKESTIKLNGSLPHNTVEAITSLNKQLLSEICKTNGKWIFIKLELNDFLVDSVSVSEIRINAVKFDSPRMTKSEIWINDRMIGFIYFSNVSSFQ